MRYRSEAFAARQVRIRTWAALNKTGANAVYAVAA